MFTVSSLVRWTIRTHNFPSPLFLGKHPAIVTESLRTLYFLDRISGVGMVFNKVFVIRPQRLQLISSVLFKFDHRLLGHIPSAASSIRFTRAHHTTKHYTTLRNQLLAVYNMPSKFLRNQSLRATTPVSESRKHCHSYNY